MSSELRQTLGTHTSQSHRGEAVAPAQRPRPVMLAALGVIALAVLGIISLVALRPRGDVVTSRPAAVVDLGAPAPPPSRHRRPSVAAPTPDPAGSAGKSVGSSRSHKDRPSRKGSRRGSKDGDAKVDLWNWAHRPWRGLSKGAAGIAGCAARAARDVEPARSALRPRPAPASARPMSGPVGCTPPRTTPPPSRCCTPRMPSSRCRSFCSTLPRPIAD